ncbi:MAG: SAM-dependent DNA methyltransferase, partial [Planctomycetes bacterium]|nr:SAM-dependent DNA methyltransferase [Planctomycetota bacterium]
MAKENANNKSSGNLGFENDLWRAADALRSNMDAAEYKHVVLGLIFLKYISDAFEEQHAKLDADRKSGADPEDADEYRACNIFWVHKEARWSNLKANAKQPTIGKTVDDLREFAAAEGRKGGQFWTPQCAVGVLVAMLAPFKGRVYDPCCGSGGMFVQSVEFVKAHATGNGNAGKAKADISIFGQESNHTTWKLAKMNLAIRQIENNLGKEHADSFHRDLHPDLKADYVLANPPFNDSDWRGELLKDDKRWKYGT